MLKKILQKRCWSFRLSLKNRKCYLSGDSLWMKFAYRGRRTMSSVLTRNRPYIDDIWLSTKEFDLKTKDGDISVS